MMQYPVYNTYPFSFYPCYPNYPSSGYNFGLYGTYYGYQPWTVERANSGMMEHGNPGTRNASALANNGYYQNYHLMNSKYFPQYVTPQYSTYYQWSPYSMTNWFNPQQPLNQASPWGPFYNYDKWLPMQMNFNGGMFYSWPMMNYYSNRMMFPNYLCPSPTYWGVQQTIDLPQTDSNRTGSQQGTSSETKTLKATSSEVIRDFNLPPAIAKRTRSDIPRPSSSDVKESDESKDDMELPYLFRVSDTSIKQIASSRSFGPSMVYNTDSDNKPLPPHWQLP